MAKVTTISELVRVQSVEEEKNSLLLGLITSPI